MVNTCGFIEAAKRDSIDTLLDAADGGSPVVAVGCLAERYGEAARQGAARGRGARLRRLRAIGERLDDVVAGRGHRAALSRGTAARCFRSRRSSGRRARSTSASRATPVARRRCCGAGSTGEPVAPLKLASGCDRRCAFCAIPSFRGAFVSRPPDDIVAEARVARRSRRARAGAGQRELHVVRQGPRRPAGAREAAAAARGGRRRRAGAGLLPAAGGDAPVAGRRDDRYAGGRGVLRRVVPARERAVAAPDAPVRWHRPVPRR